MINAELLASVASLVGGGIGFYCGRRETRLETLSSLLTPMIRSLQALADANSSRRTAERLKRSYPAPSGHPNVIETINSHVNAYNEQVECGSKSFKEFECDLGAKKFRLPDSIGSIFQSAKTDLSELGKHVNGGHFDQAHICLAKVLDHQKKIALHGRGWRLVDPFEGIKSRLASLKKSPEPARGEFDLDEKQMNRIMKLVHVRMTTESSNSFVIHAPQKLLENPAIAESDSVIAELSDTFFEVVFQSGEYEMLTFPEFMTFVYQLIFVCHQQNEIWEMLKESATPATVTVKMTLCVEKDVMQPEVVKALLKKVNFSDEPSDGSSGRESEHGTGEP